MFSVSNISKKNSLSFSSFCGISILNLKRVPLYTISSSNLLCSLVTPLCVSVVCSLSGKIEKFCKNLDFVRQIPSLTFAFSSTSKAFEMITLEPHSFPNIASAILLGKLFRKTPAREVPKIIGSPFQSL
ncbi:hypothetical protein NCR94_03305 [Helicobacter sp. 16470-15]|nr:hypothetical protein [Helicobacter colisuis]MCL9822562.1 hypothetical protein [Helicobacter colisuis]